MFHLHHKCSRQIFPGQLEVFYGSCSCRRNVLWKLQMFWGFWAATTLACPISRVLLKCSIEMVFEAANVLKPAFELPGFCHLAVARPIPLNHFILLPTSCLVGVILELWRYNFVFTFTLFFMIDWLLNWKSVQNSHIVKRASCPLPSINSLKESFLTKLW